MWTKPHCLYIKRLAIKTEDYNKKKVFNIKIELCIFKIYSILL